MTVVEGLVNLRDLGGLPVVGGGVTEAGVLYRSDAPYPDDEHPDHVPIWPPAAVLDLRSQAERDVIGHAWTGETRLHHHPLHDAAAPTSQRSPHLAGLYADILDSVPERIAGVLAVAAQADGPLLIHCAAGKDRTGIAVAALLLAADVEPEAVVADYVVTADNMESLRTRWKRKGKVPLPGRPDIPAAWLLAPEDAIRHVVARFMDWPGGASSWLVDHGASPQDLERWRARFTS
ncbi:protein-tyrosine-phosphatase [Aeromicrobium sp. SMF47]|uniref:Protein-tyrosine-phosphatase n=1 Tax=Aeromicrobium yanjiei TaxID=2662028 RepID=A0A5Q2MEM3_9ACTN|nr:MULTISPECIES: tyrosine-protein phosphatase [Aeromicrobium]MRJ77307.1 protein-tyrosine-phosphatase [Aeromicrobium yanjiei]MRK01674.1 protein-tyrosine-phosphatase [Aeromicrobium sp. S22]QGG41567.1 protein-tyrosine-phosphatase [Aeromicrobium yanjiei]